MAFARRWRDRSSGRLSCGRVILVVAATELELAGVGPPAALAWLRRRPGRGRRGDRRARSAESVPTAVLHVGIAGATRACGIARAAARRSAARPSTATSPGRAGSRPAGSPADAAAAGRGPPRAPRTPTLRPIGTSARVGGSDRRRRRGDGGLRRAAGGPARRRARARAAGRLERDRRGRPAPLALRRRARRARRAPTAACSQEVAACMR